MQRRDVRIDISSHTPGTPKGEERLREEGPEPGRRSRKTGRTARDATGINAEARDPIDPAMPHLPPP